MASHAQPSAIDAGAAAIAFSGASKRYRNGTQALRDTSWSIPIGSRSCLLGPNGSGKTTSIRLLEGALSPTSGHVSLLGTRVNGPGYQEARRRVGVVPQNAGMYPDFTTREYLQLARRLFGRGDVERALEAFGLADQGDKRLAQLSGGFQRRALLAAALLPEPDVLLLDEPTVGLDPVAAHEVHAYLATAMAGRTTLLCTHDLAEAETLCDDVIILRSGSVLLHEPLAALRHRQRPHVRLAARQGIQPLVRALRARGLEPHVDGEHAIVPIDAQAQAPSLLRGLLGAGLDVYECTPFTATLEDIFLEAVRA
jgi:ABC-2 type transport system ATP-binding protein